jgi:hypothetical protein
METVMKFTVRFLVWMLAITAPLGTLADTLESRIEVEQAGTSFAYTVFNDEPSGSSRHVNIWTLDVNAPFEVVSTPQGWDYTTDHRSYVTWFSADSTEPFLNDIAPETFMEGFVLESVVSTSEELPYAIISWEHGDTHSGPSATGEVAVPSVISLVASLVNVTHSLGEYQFTIIGIPTLQYVVEVSYDLAEWTQLLTNAVPFTFKGAMATGSKAQFFRVVCADSFGLDSDLE